jgi:hypothetical protein
MQLNATLFATLFFTSAVFANAIPQVPDELNSDIALNATESTAIEDGVPSFDPVSAYLPIMPYRRKDSILISSSSS